MQPIARSTTPNIRPAAQVSAPQAGTKPEVPTSSKVDGLTLTGSVPQATNSDALQALGMFHKVTARSGALHGEGGEHLTPEQAVERLSNGQEVVAKVPATRGPARSLSHLLLELKDAASALAPLLTMP